MSSILSIANDICDDLSYGRVESLFAYEEGDTTARRLKRAIEGACLYLAAKLDWQEIKRDYEFLTVAGEVQPRAVPHDLLRFVGDTLWDVNRRIPIRMAASEPDFQFFRSYPVNSWEFRWVRRDNDILIQPSLAADLKIRYTYVSNEICKEPPSPHRVTYTTDGETLTSGRRYIVRTGHNVILGEVNEGSIELVPEGGLWENLGATFTTASGAAITNRCPVGYRDWLSVVRNGSNYDLVPAFGAWSTLAEATTNGMTLQPNKRYLVGQGHVVYLPIMRAGEQIEIIPSTLAWNGHGSRFITRNGTAIDPAQVNVTLATITADMSGTNGYVASAGGSTVEPILVQNKKHAFTKDTDEPLWDDELVRLGAIWKLLYRDGNTYNEDFRAFEAMMYDRFKGSQGYGVIAMGGEDPHRRKMPIPAMPAGWFDPNNFP